MSRSEPEVWKDVPSVSGLQASSWGRIQLQPYLVVLPHGGMYMRKVAPSYGCKVPKPRRMTKRVRGMNIKIHQAVCEAFHGKAPSPKHRVLHTDEDGWNNVPENLRWGTQKENLNAPGFKAYCKARTGDNSPTKKYRRKAEMDAWD